MNEIQIAKKIQRPISVGWFKYEKNASQIFIFVHGLFSSVKECWMSQNKIFWPELIEVDSRLKGVGIFCAEYHTSPRAGEYGVSDCASRLLKYCF